jgi:hypothetical protein
MRSIRSKSSPPLAQRRPEKSSSCQHEPSLWRHSSFDDLQHTSLFQCKSGEVRSQNAWHAAECTAVHGGQAKVEMPCVYKCCGTSEAASGRRQQHVLHSLKIISPIAIGALVSRELRQYLTA